MYAADATRTVGEASSRGDSDSIRRHIALLHKYNERKVSLSFILYPRREGAYEREQDATQVLIGKVISSSSGPPAHPV